MNLLQIKTEVKRTVGRHDAQFDDRITWAVNRAVRDWARAFPWETLRVSGTVTARGGNALVFPAGVDRLIWLADKTNTAPLDAGNRQWDRSDTYSLVQQTAGLARQWETVGYVPTFTDVSGPIVAKFLIESSTAATVSIVGDLLLDSGAGDHTDIEGIEYLGVTDNSGVTSGTTWKKITSVRLLDRAPRLLKLLCGGNLVSVIRVDEYEPVYYKVRLLDTPTTGTVFQYEAFRRPRDLVYDGDVVPPGVNTDYLLWDASSDIFTQLKEDERAAMAKARAARIARDVKAVEVQFGDWAGQIIPEDLK